MSILLKLGSAFLLALALACATTLSGCAAEGVPRDAKEPPQQFELDGKNELEDHSGEEFAGQAVISVAGVDVDGLNASAAGYITQVIRDGLQCEFTFTQGGASVVRTAVSIADRSGSSCGVVSVPTAELQRGTWEVKLLVTGADRDIAPDMLTMEVP